MIKVGIILVVFALSAVLIPPAMAHAVEQDTNFYLGEILSELRDIKKELKNSMAIQVEMQGVFNQVEYNRQQILQNTNALENANKELEAMTGSALELNQRLSEIRDQMPISNPTVQSEYNNLVITADLQQKRIATLKSRAADLTVTIGELNKKIDDMMSKFQGGAPMAR